MHKHFSASVVVIVVVAFTFGSCASFGKKGASLARVPSVVSPLKVPPPEKPEEPVYIMGRGKANPDTLSGFLLQHNPALGKLFTDAFARIYVEEAALEGVNADIAFAQMCLETGFLAFRGQVTPDMNNFAGIGTTGPGVAGERFPSPQIGVRAQIQHLKAYATPEPLKGELVDPRYKWVKYGSAPSIADLSGKWAADKSYGVKIKSMLDRIYLFHEKGA
jgi:hypothetical protein